VILTRHDPRRIERCLNALARLEDRIPYEVLVLLNGADADVRAAMAVPRHDVRVLESPVNLGFAGGCNRASAHTKGRYLLFLNDDTEVQGGWLRALVSVAETSPKIGAVGSCVLFPDGSVQEAGSIVWQDGSIAAFGRGAQPDAPAVSFVRDVDYCSACSLLVRREAWAAARGFCEDYFPAYYEDVDFCLSLRACGYRVVYAPRSRVTHEGGRSTDAQYRAFLNHYQKQRFRQRWKDVLTRFEPANPTSPAAVRRAMFRASGRLRRLLIIGGSLRESGPDSARSRILDAVIQLAAAGYAVSVWAAGAVDRTARELGTFGVETIAGRLEDHVRDPGVLYDTVLVTEPSHFDRFELMIRQGQPHCVLMYDADAVHHERLASRALVAGVAQRTVLAEAAQAMRAVETRVRAHADFVTCASVAEEAFLRSTAGTAPVFVVAHSPRAARVSQLRHSTAQPARTDSVWPEALRQAQFSRTLRTARAASL
jgi:GT2 family glycosyltransferase